MNMCDWGGCPPVCVIGGGTPPPPRGQKTGYDKVQSASTHLCLLQPEHVVLDYKVRELPRYNQRRSHQ
jgi:hypothetical protein